MGAGDGLIANSTAIGNVLGGGNSVLGGFIGALSFENGAGVILSSLSAGSVTSTGPNSIVGGFAGLTGGTIVDSASIGAVTGTSDSYLGGFAGVNLGTILASSTAPSASVTGTGNRDIVGGFVGANFGSIDSSSSAGDATGGALSTVGGFAGTNARFINFAPGSIPASSFPSGSITNSSASGSATGGPGSTTGPFVASNDPTSASRPPAFPSIVGNCNDALCFFINTGILPPPSGTSLDEFLQSLAAQQTQIILNLTSLTQLAALSTPPVVSNIQGAIKTPVQPPAGATGAGAAARTANPARPRAQGRGYSAGHRDPPDPGRGGGADRHQRHARPAAGRRSTARSDGDRVGEPDQRGIDRGASEDHQRQDPGGRDQVNEECRHGRDRAAELRLRTGPGAPSRRRRRGAIRPSSRATPRNTSWRSSRCWTFTAWSGAPISRSR